MIQYLLDTNIVSELARPRPNPGMARLAFDTQKHGISAVTVEELQYGMTRTPSPRVERFMARYLAETRVLPITADIAARAGRLRGDFARRGIVRHQPDMLIAATAQAHNLTLVTRNVRDFEGCGIGLLNPFTD